MIVLSRRGWLLAALLVAGASAWGAEPSANDRVAKAKVLLDAYYGQRAKLDEAVALLQEAMTDKPWPPELYVQAARATIMGGHIVRDQYRGNTIERELALLDEATKLDPNYAKPYILRAEAFRTTNRGDEALAQLDKAKALRPDDPWLWNGYGDYYWRLYDRLNAKTAWTKAVGYGRGTSEESRKAYVVGNDGLARFASTMGDVDGLRHIAAEIDKTRHPDDAWVLGTLSGYFFFVAQFDEAVSYARRALDVMDYGVGRRWLAASLYAKACIAFKAGQPWEGQVREARSLGYAPEDVAKYFQNVLPGTPSLVSTLLDLPKDPIVDKPREHTKPAFKT